MPIYEYKCENGHVFDVMQRLSEDPLTACVECSAPVRKVLQPVGISFKGSGFYSTDYKNGAKKTESPKNGDSEERPAATDKKDEKKSAVSSEKATGKRD
jgi:putative FmdB family regulatory protein